MKVALRILVVVLVIVSSAEVWASSCTNQPGGVTFHATRTNIREALRELAAQSGKNISLATNVRGQVSGNFECADLRVVLSYVVAQVEATYCEEDNLIRVSRRQQSDCPRPQPVVELTAPPRIRGR